MTPCDRFANVAQNYAEALTAETAVFPYNQTGHGPMAKFLERPSPASSTGMAPRGRSRDIPDFFAPPSVQ